MPIAIITGAAGLIGAEAVRFFSGQGLDIVGIDNDMRQTFFGPEASTRLIADHLRAEIGNYDHRNEDIRDVDAMDRIFREFNADIRLVIHTAAQPSHDWAARDPRTDFAVNATGTLNLLESTRQHAAGAVFIFTSTNKVYGDRPNQLPLVEQDTRWELPEDHACFNGIPEDMPIDNCLHSVFGTSKLAADVMVQEYGRYFDMKTVCFRGGCLTGPGHSAAELHGFLAYLVKCCVTGTPYRVFGYRGKQVRDNIHCHDLIQAFNEFYLTPRRGEVYNIGGGRHCNCSMQEAITLTEQITGKRLNAEYVDDNRVGDHVWWISGLGKFERDYPRWQITYNLGQIIEEICSAHTHAG